MVVVVVPFASPSPYVFPLFITLVTFPLFVPMVCRNICLRLYAATQVSGSHYLGGGKYCRICECYFVTKAFRCECCGMQLRATATERELKEKLTFLIKQ